MDYKIVASDLDGTLLNEEGKISEENWRAVEEMKNRGILFVPASGRCFMELPAELRESPLIRYYITSDGASVYDKETGESRELLLSNEKGKEVLDRLFQYPICLMVHSDIHSYADENTHNEQDYASFHLDRYWIDYALEKEVPVSHFKDFVYGLDGISMLVPFFKSMEDLESCKADFEKDPELLVVQSDPYNLEIVSSKAGKGNALLLLAHSLGIDRRETIAIGDSANDDTMVRAAGLGLAMENAVDELKMVADAVICHHRDHAAKYILERYFS